MKNKEKLISNFNSSDDSIKASVTILDKEETELDLYPDLLLDGSDGSLTIVINHDYYSSNTAHGKFLLKSFLEVLKDEFSKISKIFILDSGVSLLSKDNDLNDVFSDLANMDFDIVVCKESISEFGIDASLYPSIRESSIHEIALELLSAPYLISLG